MYIKLGYKLKVISVLYIKLQVVLEGPYRLERAS